MTMRDSIQAAQRGEPHANADGSTTWEFCFPMSDPVFTGHFPGRPILPGIFQLELARNMAEKVLGCELAVREIVKAKFQQPVLPNETVRAELKLADKDGAIQSRASFSVKGRAVGETILSLCRND